MIEIIALKFTPINSIAASVSPASPSYSFGGVVLRFVDARLFDRATRQQMIVIAIAATANADMPATMI